MLIKKEFSLYDSNYMLIGKIKNIQDDLTILIFF